MSKSYVIVFILLICCSRTNYAGKVDPDSSTLIDTLSIYRKDFKIGELDGNDYVQTGKLKDIVVDVSYYSDVSNSYYKCLLENDTLLFEYKFEALNDRTIFINGKECSITRVVFKDEEYPTFNDFNCDYSNSRYYYGNGRILIKSTPNHWSGAILSIMKFCQLIDLEAYSCIEFFYQDSQSEHKLK